MRGRCFGRRKRRSRLKDRCLGIGRSVKGGFSGKEEAPDSCCVGRRMKKRRRVNKGKGFLRKGEALLVGVWRGYRSRGL